LHESSDLPPNGLEIRGAPLWGSRPASASNLSSTRFAAAGRVGSIELLGGAKSSWGRGRYRQAVGGELGPRHDACAETALQLFSASLAYEGASVRGNEDVPPGAQMRLKYHRIPELPSVAGGEVGAIAGECSTGNDIKDLLELIRDLG